MIGFMCFVLHRIFDRCVRKSGNGELSLRKYIPGSVACISCRSILLISKPKFWGPRIDRCECEASSLRTFREITLIIRLSLPGSAKSVDDLFKLHEISDVFGHKYRLRFEFGREWLGLSVMYRDGDANVQHRTRFKEYVPKIRLGFQ